MGTLGALQGAWVVDAVQRLPQGVLSRGWGWMARRRRPRAAVSLLKHGFVKATGIDLSEAAAPISTYDTLEDLFVRTLRAGARRIDPRPDAVVSPVDGRVGATGTIEDGTLLQVKGRSYPLADLLGDAQQAARFEGGSYATIYLSPRDYHRIHTPVAGLVHEARIIPGALMPVFPAALERVDGLFARNERLITYVDTQDGGRVAVVKVGATLVGRIALAFDPSVQTNVKNQKERALTYDPPKILHKGAELGSFQLGSTVVVVAEKGHIDLDLQPGAHLRVGECVGQFAKLSKRKRKPARSKGTKGATP